MLAEGVLESDDLGLHAMYFSERRGIRSVAVRPRATTSRDRFAVKLVVARDHAFATEKFYRAFARGRSELRPQKRVVRQLTSCFNQRLRISRPDKNAVLRADKIRNAADSKTNDRQPARHRFEHRQRRGIGDRRVQKKIQRAENLTKLFARIRSQRANPRLRRFGGTDI